MNKAISYLKSIIKAILGNNPKEFRVVVLSIIGATTFWLLNALNKNYTTTISYPFEVSYNNNDFITTTPILENIDARVTGQGWDLFWETVSFSKKPIKYSVKNLPGKTVVKGWELEQIFTKSNNSINLKKVLIDTLSLNFDNKITKTVFAKINPMAIPLAKGYVILSDIELTPDTLRLTGSEKYINKFNDTVQFFLSDVSEINDDYEDEINVSEFLKCKTAVNLIEVKFSVAKLVTRKINVPILINGLQEFDSLSSQDIPYTTITYSVPEETSTNLDSTQFKLSINVDQANPFDSIFPIQIDALPSDIYNVQIDSLVQFVSFTND